MVLGNFRPSSLLLRLFGANCAYSFRKTGNDYVGELAAAFADALEKNTTLKSLRLYHCFIGE
jgi:hypothetical protein